MQISEEILGIQKIFYKMKRPAIRIVVLMIISTMFTVHANAQYALKQARDQDSLYNYTRAIPFYEKAFRKKPTAEAARGVARAYDKQRNFTLAESWYAKLVALKDHTPQDEFHYAQSLISNGKYTEAKAVLAKVDTTKIAVNDTLLLRMIAGCDSAVYWNAHPNAGKLVNIETLNSAQSDWAATGYKGKIIFASDRPTGLKKKQPFFRNTNLSPLTYGWTGDSYQHIYSADVNDSASIAMFDTTIIKEYYHSAVASFTAEGKEMFFAITRYVKKKAKFVGTEHPYTLNIEIYYTARDSVKNRWQEPRRFPYNDILQNSVGDPFISPDGRTLYFVSGAAWNNKGGTDIYYSKRISDTAWGEPVNMGDSINTQGNERTPFFDDNGNLYFASDGYAGMGGLDIYKATPDGNGGWTVTNAGAPINSPQDELTPFFTKSYKGYFASNRLSGKGSDDIYRFDPALILRLEGEVLYVKTNQPISNAEVTLTNLKTNNPVKVITSADGTFSFTLDSLTDYRLAGENPGYTPSATENVSTVGLTESTVIHKTLYLDLIPPPPPPPPEPIAIEPVYYNFDKSNIRPDAINPLDHIVDLMKEYPAWKLEISSHTDSRGSDSYNLKLSERRAASVMSYLVEHGIDASRLTAQGFGETKLVNDCSNGVPCSAEEHQLNRRSEFIIEK